MIQDNMVAVKKAYFPYNIILWVFKKTMCNSNSKVAMIDPIFLNILTIGNNNLISASLYKHEQAHIEQVKKNGRIKFIFKYLYYNIKYGYYNNPFEVEAREKAK